MGLDMSIRMKRRVERGNKNIGKPFVRYYYKDNEEFDYIMSDDDGKIPANLKNKAGNLSRKADYAEDDFEIAYWRKANEIHKWFVDNVQNGENDCGSYILTKENLQDLLSLVTDVLMHCELKEGTIRNGYTIKKGLFGFRKKYNKMKGKVLTRSSKRYCKKHLPTFSGCFYGSLDYDEYYYNDLVYTKDILKEILLNYDFDEVTLYYESSY